MRLEIGNSNWIAEEFDQLSVYSPGIFDWGGGDI